MSASPEEQEQIRQQIPDIETVEAQELTRYQKTVKRNLLTALSRLKDEQNRLAEEISSIAAKDIYAEDYFKKTFDSLLTQTASPKNLAEQSQDARARDKESRKGRMADALALGGDEGRDKLR